MARIKGITVTLYEEQLIGYDGYNTAIYKEHPVEVSNVLVGEPTTDDITSSTSLYGKKISYMLAIPKGDAHDWVNKKVEWTDAYGIMHICKTFGFPITGVEENIPRQLPWHMKVRCESYEQQQNENQTESQGDQSGDEVTGDPVSG